jgi:hypothetical protein
LGPVRCGLYAVRYPALLPRPVAAGLRLLLDRLFEGGSRRARRAARDTTRDEKTRNDETERARKLGTN